MAEDRPAWTRRIYNEHLAGHRLAETLAIEVIQASTDFDEAELVEHVVTRVR